MLLQQSENVGIVERIAPAPRQAVFRCVTLVRYLRHIVGRQLPYG
jgi:hypothetical protein